MTLPKSHSCKKIKKSFISVRVSEALVSRKFRLLLTFATAFGRYHFKRFPASNVSEKMFR